MTVQPHDFGEARPGLDMNRLNQLVDELAVEDYLEKAAKDDSARAFAWPWKGLGN